MYKGTLQGDSDWLYLDGNSFNYCECDSNKELGDNYRKKMADFNFFSNLAARKNFGCYGTAEIRIV